MGHVEEQPAEMPGEVRVPGVGMQHLRRGVECGDHRQVGAEHSQRGIGVGGMILGVSRGSGPGFAHAVDIDGAQISELTHQLCDMHTGASIDMRWVFPGQQRHMWSHEMILSGQLGGG